MVARRGQAAATLASGDTPPTTRVPGASVAARAEADRRRGASPADAEGFQQVRCGAAAARQASATPVARAGGPLAPRLPVVTRNSRAAMAEEEMDEDEDDIMPSRDDIEVDDQADDDGEGEPARLPHADGDAGDDDERGGEGGPEELDESELKQMWTAHCNAVRVLERDPQTPHGLLADARARRDAAEARWRAAKKPHPRFKRLRWAEMELREAEAKEQQHRRELEQHQVQAARRTKELEERVAVDAARSGRRRAAIEALHAEGAQQRPKWSTDRAAIVAATGISTDVAPALLAAIERLGAQQGVDKETVIQELQLVAVSLNRVEGVLRDAAELSRWRRGPQAF